MLTPKEIKENFNSLSDLIKILEELRPDDVIHMRVDELKPITDLIETLKHNLSEDFKKELQ